MHNNYNESVLLMFIAIMNLLEKDFGKLEVSLEVMSMYSLYSVIIRA